MDTIPLSDGRRLFGSDPKAYAEARPDYPDALYERLTTRCGLRPGVSVFEVGPGPGLATRRLLSLGASPLRATDHLFVGTADSPSWSAEKRIPFAFDRDRRLQDLAGAGFKDAKVEVWSSNLTCDTARLVALYSTYSPIQALEPDSRREFLSNLAQIANEQFGGRVQRPLITVLYTARRG